MKSSFVAVLCVLLCVFTQVLGSKHKQLTDTKVNNGSDPNKPKVGPEIGHFSLDFLKKSSKHGKRNKSDKKMTRKSKRKASELMKKIKECMHLHGAKLCKEQNLSKKAMIWPKKMLPALEKMLMNKLNGGPDIGYDGNSISSSKNFIGDNWDNVKHPDPPRPNMFNGMEVVPLLKMLKEKTGVSSPDYSSNSFAGLTGNLGGSKYTKMLVNQALGKTDRGSVMKDMMQEFYLAGNNNNNERSGQEAREAFNELMGRKANSDLIAGNPDFNIGMLPGGSDAQGRMTMPDKVQNYAPQEGDNSYTTGGLQNSQGFQAGSVGGGGGGGLAGLGGSVGGGAGGIGGVLQAQELPNGKIAPVGPQSSLVGSTLQQMMPMNANPTTRMLGSSVKFSNEPLAGDQVVENQMPTSVAAMHDSNSRPLFMERNNDVVFEERGENAARGMKAANFEDGNSFMQENGMKSEASFRSLPVPERNLYAANGGFEIQGNRFTSFAPDVQTLPQELAPSRRDKFPTKHKHHKSDMKTPQVRSKHVPKKMNKKLYKKSKHSARPKSD